MHSAVVHLQGSSVQVHLVSDDTTDTTATTDAATTETTPAGGEPTAAEGTNATALKEPGPIVPEVKELAWSAGSFVVFALLMLPRSACYSAGARWGGLVLGLAIFCALALSPSYFMFGAFVWLLGALTRVAPRPLIRSKWLALVVWLAAVSAIRLVTRGAIVDDHPRKELLDAINALLFANILLTLRFDTGEGFSWCRARFHHALADFSYTLYATHMPILVFLWALIAAFAGDAWRMQLATPTHYAVATGALLFCMACAWLMSRFTEARTGAVRAWLRRVAPGARSAEKSATLSPS